MLYGIVDIGSNTIRLCIYDCAGTEFKTLLVKKETAGLLGYVEKGMMSPAGIERCIEALRHCQEAAGPFELDGFFVFATASLRNIQNSDEAVRRIYEELRIQVEVLPGREEALLDFAGAVKTTGMQEGLLVDIGGGSIELVSFSQGKAENMASVNLGSLSLYKRFVKDLIPTSRERHSIRDAVEEQLVNLQEFQGRSYPEICGIGGTFRNTCHLYNARCGLPQENLSFPAGAVKQLLRPYKNPEKEDLDLLVQVAPERVHTLVPGMIAMQAIFKTFQAEQVMVSLCGVREGYLYERILKKTLI